MEASNYTPFDERHGLTFGTISEQFGEERDWCAMEFLDRVGLPGLVADGQPVSDQTRLFGVLPSGLFSVFHRSSRTEYARIILEVWRQFFADPLQEQPSAREVAAFIERQLRSRRSAVCEPYGSEMPGQGIYQNLVEAGWLATYPDGYRKLVEMPEAVSRLVRFLSDLERGTPASLGGAVSSMLSALRAARDNPEVHALAVRETAHQAEKLLWRLRSLVVGLRRQEGLILEQRSAGDVLGRFFDRFIGVVISDWHTLKTAQNPYRHRGEIVEVATALLDDDSRLRRLAFVYAEQDLARGIADGVRLVAEDLDRIRDGLLGLDMLTDRIDAVRRRVERRIAITVSYMELAGSVTTLRLADLLGRLGRDSGPDDRMPVATLAPPDICLGPDMLSGPRRQRARIEAGAPVRHPPDPRLDAFITARREFQERVRIGNRLLTEFAARQLGDGPEIHAAEVRVELLEDVVAFCAMPVVAGRGRTPRGIGVRLLTGRAAAGGIEGPDYVMRNTADPAAANDAG